MTFRKLAVDTIESFQRNGLPNFASAMAFRVVLALVPFLLFLLFLLAVLELLPRSLSLGAAMGLCVVVAIAIVRFGPLLTGDVDGLLAVLSFLVRWLLANAFLVGIQLDACVRERA